jgi:hypothetical protein
MNEENNRLLVRRLAREVILEDIKDPKIFGEITKSGGLEKFLIELLDRCNDKLKVI